MAKPRATQPLKTSVLDRLLDENPGVATDPPALESKSHRELRRSVRRDLENLLNTRQRALSWPKNLQELDCSLLSYGIPDFAAINLGSAEGPPGIDNYLGDRSGNQCFNVILQQRFTARWQQRLRRAVGKRLHTFSLAGGEYHRIHEFASV
jgi:hypothetical protein